MPSEPESPPPLPSQSGLAIRRVLRRSRLWSSVALALGGYLVDEGWYRSFRSQRSEDKDGNPLPWYTYPCTEFLERRLSGGMRVFEYGAGMSSLWYGERVKEVVSVEHDAHWAEVVQAKAPPSCRIVLVEGEESYIGAIAEFAPFDIAVVDGENRQRAAAAALGGLKHDGVIIWDNSNWPDFYEAFPALQEKGFKQIAFAGLGPISRSRWETSILYRAENCLGI